MKEAERREGGMEQGRRVEEGDLGIDDSVLAVENALSGRRDRHTAHSSHRGEAYGGRRERKRGRAG